MFAYKIQFQLMRDDFARAMQYIVKMHHKIYIRQPYCETLGQAHFLYLIDI